MSGCTDHFAQTEDDGYETGREAVASFNIPPPIEPAQYEDPVYDVTELPGCIPESQQHNMNMYQVKAWPHRARFANAARLRAVFHLVFSHTEYGLRCRGPFGKKYTLRMAFGVTRA